jgi:hypothetical protein
MKIKNLRYKSEAELQQKAFICIFNKYPKLRGAFYHNYNNPRNAVQGAQLKGMGLQKGNPDFTLAVKTETYGALYIELKLQGEKLKPEQIDIHAKLISFGNKVVVCYEEEEVEIEVVDYLKFRLDLLK